MKLPLSWLTEHAPLAVDVTEIAEALTQLGLEVEGVEFPRQAVRGVVVGRIRAMRPHPNADRLRLLEVEAGGEAPLSIVCGAANMGEGDRVPVATVGARLPNGLKIKKGKIRGESSFGMCCSEVELGLAEESDGLMILPEDAPVGAEVGDYLGLEEAIFDLSVTPNRGDCMSVRGIARDLAAYFDVPLAGLPEPSADADAGVAAADVEVESAEDCPLYLARRIEGVALADSPDWMRQRLLAAGMRPVNGVVDVLNYVMLDVGQPMHAFDASALAGDLQVRRAREGEAFTGLDGRALTLAGDELVVADERGPVALAGVLGSEASGVTGSSGDVVLEAAVFRPARASLAARRHGTVTEASMRFERGIDASLTGWSMARATQLITELFGGRPGPVTTRGEADALLAPRRFDFEAERVTDRLGVAVPAAIDDVLARMGFGVARRDGRLEIEVPPHRHDVRIPEDVIEEYARVHGFDRIPELLPPLTPGAHHRSEVLLDPALAAGFSQVVTYAFIGDDEQRLFAGEPERDVALANPISETMRVMRRSLWPGLLDVARHNLNRQQPGVALVESGRTYARAGEGYAERSVLAWLLAGERESAEWYGGPRSADFFDLKGALEQWLAARGLAGRFVADDELAGLQPGQSARIHVGRHEAGCVGRVDAEIAARFDLDLPVFVAEIDLETLPAGRPVRFAPLPEYPSVSRDLVFLFDRGHPAEAIVRAASRAAGGLAAEVRVFDRYTGRGVPEGKVSLGLRLELQATDRTLTHDEVESVAEAVIGEMAAHFDAELRG